MSDRPTTAQLLSQHANLMNHHGPDSEEVQRFVAEHQDDAKFLKLSQLSAALKRALLLDKDAPLIIQYTNILHAFGGPDSAEAKAFLALHARDATFRDRALTLNEVWKLQKPDRDKDKD